MRVLGVDPGLTRCGIGVVDGRPGRRAVLVHVGVVTTPPGADLADRLLAPLDALAPGPRARTAATLRAWLDHPGQVQRVGAVLHVHPQTVRYRLVKLRELFGDQLEDPDARFALALALRARGGEDAPEG